MNTTMIEAVMQVISDNRAWILPLLLAVEIPVMFWMVARLLSDGYRELRGPR